MTHIEAIEKAFQNLINVAAAGALYEKDANGADVVTQLGKMYQNELWQALSESGCKRLDYFDVTRECPAFSFDNKPVQFFTGYRSPGHRAFMTLAAVRHGRAIHAKDVQEIEKTRLACDWVKKQMLADCDKNKLLETVQISLRS